MKEPKNLIGIIQSLKPGESIEFHKQLNLPAIKIRQSIDDGNSIVAVDTMIPFETIRYSLIEQETILTHTINRGRNKMEDHNSLTT